MNRNIIVLAGSGYLGDAIKKISNNYTFEKIIEFSRTKKINTKNDIEHYQVDFDKELKANNFNDKTSIIYMAPPRQDVEGDVRLLNFSKSLGYNKIKKIVYISTSGVYGDHQGGIVDESAECIPITDRAKRRLIAEQIIRNYCEKTKNEFVILRVPGIYGPKRLPIERIIAGEPIMEENLAKPTNLIHVEDLARISWEVMDSSVKNEIINVSDGNPTTSTRYYIEICKILNLPVPKTITLNEAKKVFSKKRMSFFMESRVLNVKKLNHLFPDIIKYKDLKEGIQSSI